MPKDDRNIVQSLSISSEIDIVKQEQSITPTLPTGVLCPSLTGEGGRGASAAATRRGYDERLRGRGCGKQLYGATIGTFDGVHRGHCYLLRQLRTLAAERGLSTMALTFLLHPATTLGHPAPPELSKLGDKMDHLLNEVDEVKVLDFTADMARLTAREFMKYLRDEYGVRLLLLGHDHRFGRPTPDDDYERDGSELGIEVVRALPLPINEAVPALGTISSSVIRRALIEGRLDDANDWLGYPYILTGPVVRGHQVGRTLGFPTANLRCDQLLPQAGVYSVWVNEEPDMFPEPAILPEAGLPALLNIGHRPTMQNGSDLSVEVHIPGFSGDLYHRYLRLGLLRRLRDEQQFPSLEALRSQIQRDLAAL